MKTLLVKCLECPRPARNRGVCNTCRQRQRLAVKAGETTEAKLMAAGRLLPKSEKKWCHDFVVSPRKGA